MTSVLSRLVAFDPRGNTQGAVVPASAGLIPASALGHDGTAAHLPTGYGVAPTVVLSEMDLSSMPAFRRLS